MVLNVVQRSSFFKGYYEHKKKGLHRPLEKKEALCAVILKFIRVLFALMRDRRMFTEEINRCESSVTGGAYDKTWTAAASGVKEDNVVVEGGPCVFVGIEACMIQLGQLPPAPLICIR